MGSWYFGSFKACPLPDILDLSGYFKAGPLSRINYDWLASAMFANPCLGFEVYSSVTELFSIELISDASYSMTFEPFVPSNTKYVRRLLGPRFERRLQFLRPTQPHVTDFLPTRSQLGSYPRPIEDASSLEMMYASNKPECRPWRVLVFSHTEVVSEFVLQLKEEATERTFLSVGYWMEYGIALHSELLEDDSPDGWVALGWCPNGGSRVAKIQRPFHSKRRVGFRQSLRRNSWRGPDACQALSGGRCAINTRNNKRRSLLRHSDVSKSLWSSKSFYTCELGMAFSVGVTLKISHWGFIYEYHYCPEDELDYSVHTTSISLTPSKLKYVTVHTCLLSLSATE
jgi:hypothetical protein